MEENNNQEQQNNLGQQEGERFRRPFSGGSREPREKRPFNKEEGGGRFKGGFGFKKKKCRFCGKEKKELDKELNYKNLELIQKFVTDRGKILPARITGTCFLHQKRVQLEVKRARYMAFLPFTKVEKITK